jgi:hypothetical protein
MAGNGHSLLAAVALGLLFGSPWIVASVVLWRRWLRDDDAVAPSLGELARRRWLS